MPDTEWWRLGPIEGGPAALQPVAHIHLQIRESAGALAKGTCMAPVIRECRPRGKKFGRVIEIATT